MNVKKTALSAAIAVTMGLSVASAPGTASAAAVTGDWTGLFTLLNGSGNPSANTSYPYYDDPTWGYGLRTQISGTLAFDTSTGAGSATVNEIAVFIIITKLKNMLLFTSRKVFHFTLTFFQLTWGEKGCKPCF